MDGLLIAMTAVAATLTNYQKSHSTHLDAVDGKKSRSTRSQMAKRHSDATTLYLVLLT